MRFSLSQVARFLRDRRGAVAVIFALTSPILIGFVGLGLEVSLWYKTQMDLQAIADAAAMAGARELAAAAAAATASGTTPSVSDTILTNAAKQSATQNGCTPDNCCWLDDPVTQYKSSSSQSSNNAVSVTARAYRTYLFVGYFMGSSGGASTTTVPKTTTTAGNSCGTLAISANGKAAYEFPTDIETTYTTSTVSTPVTSTVTTPVTTTSTYYTSETTSGYSGACILGLDSTAMYTVWLKNNATLKCAAASNSRCQGVNSAQCTLDATTYGSYSCSPSIDPQCGATLADASSASLYLSENAQIQSNASSAGKVYKANNSSITGTTVANANQMVDPYASFTVSAPSATSNLVVSGSGTKSHPYNISVAANTCSTGEILYSNNVYLTIQPGCYNGMNASNNVFITLNAGTYYFKKEFVLGNNVSITATNGTTIVFVGSGANSYAIDIQNNAALTIVAPSSGTFPGIALMGDTSGKENIVQTFSNNAILSVKGVIYFRKQIINMENNAISDANGCLQLVGRRVLFSNNAVLGNKCGGIGTLPISYGQTTTLVPHTVTSTTYTTQTVTTYTTQTVTTPVTTTTIDTTSPNVTLGQ